MYVHYSVQLQPSIPCLAFTLPYQASASTPSVHDDVWMGCSLPPKPSRQPSPPHDLIRPLHNFMHRSNDSKMGMEIDGPEELSDSDAPVFDRTQSSRWRHNVMRGSR
jgi:hypothetical protein